MNKILAFGTAALLLAVSTELSATPVPTNTTANWNTDRYPTNSFTSGVVLGNPALEFTVSSADDLNNRSSPYNSTFYNTQGVSQAINTGDQTGSWDLNGEVDLTTADLSGTGLFDTGLWAETGDNSGYYIVDFLSGISSRTYGAAATTEFTTEVWNDNTGLWTTVSAPLTLGWNTVDISYSALTGNIGYSVDGTLVSTELAVNSFDSSANDLSTVLLDQDNLFGGGNGVPNTGTYNADWSNINYSVGTVPDGASTACLLGLSFLGLMMVRPRKAKKGMAAAIPFC